MASNERAPTLAALSRAARRDPGRPLITYDDRRTGERVELSVATFDNWVSKIANLLADDLGLDPGATIAIRLPPHWQAAVTVVGAWAAGLVLVDPHTPADVTVVGPADAARPDPAATGYVIACSLRPLGGRFTDPLPQNWLDFALEVPPQPDALTIVHQPSGSDRAVIRDSDGGVQLTHDDLAVRATEVAARAGLSQHGRLATDLDLLQAPGLELALVAPILLDGGVVVVAGADDEARARVVTQEAATSIAWRESPEGARS